MLTLKKTLSYITLILLIPLLLYLGTSALLMLFPTHQYLSSPLHKTNNTIALTHDIAHANFLIDLSTSTTDWQRLLPDLVPEKSGYLLAGWGEEEVYTQTPNWSDLRASSAFKALLMNTPGTLYFRYFPEAPNQYLQVTPLWLDDTTLQTIESEIMNSFATANYQKSPTPVFHSPGYGTNDQFYYALGKYNLFTTCNTWVGEILEKANVPVSPWTPFSYNIVYSIPASFKGQE